MNYSRWIRKNSAKPSVVIRRRSFSGGFSLVELLVAVSIFIILSTTFLLNYGSFDRRVTVDILAHQIATWVHDAQVSAMSIKRARNDAGKFPGYGLYFDTTAGDKFTFFADLNGDHLYTPYGVGAKCGDDLVECEQEIRLLQGNIVASICGDSPSSSGQQPTCASVNPQNPPLYPSNIAHIVFTRPNPFDATILGDLNTAVIPQVPTVHAHVEITVASPKGYRHTITIWTTGQISVR